MRLLYSNNLIVTDFLHSFVLLFLSKKTGLLGALEPNKFSMIQAFLQNRDEDRKNKNNDTATVSSNNANKNNADLNNSGGIANNNNTQPQAM